MNSAVRFAWVGIPLAIGIAALTALAAGPASAATKSPAMQACSDQWSQMKTDGTVPDGQKWPQFWSQCAKDYAAAHPDDTASAADKNASAGEEPPPAKGKSPAMQACSDAWAKLKDAGKIPAGTTWPKFWSECSKQYAASHPDAAAPAKPAAAPAKEATKEAAKPAAAPAAGQTAMQFCSDQWGKMKDAGKVPDGTTWPKFWSQCSKDYAAANGSATTPAAMPAPGQTAMQFCSDQWAKMKDAGKVPDGTTWPKFWSQCSKDVAAAGAAAPAKETATPAKTAPAATDDAEAAAAKGKSPAMTACSDQWSKMKDAGKVPAGTTWPKFWSQCSKDYAAGKIEDEDVGAPLPAPDVAAKINPDKPVAGKKEPTPGQKAVWARMRACGAEWQKEKKAGSLPTGAKWPQYWSDCNKRLKAKGM